MNILFFLKPKNETAYIYSDYTVRQAVEKMKHYGYTAIPVIDRDGKYIATITEGDLLWFLLKTQKCDIEHSNIMDIHKRVINISVNIDADIEDLIDKSLSQNFVPVVDDNNVYIGIVTRKDIIQYLCKKCQSNQN